MTHCFPTPQTDDLVTHTKRAELSAPCLVNGDSNPIVLTNWIPYLTSHPPPLSPLYLSNFGFFFLSTQAYYSAPLSSIERRRPSTDGVGSPPLTSMVMKPRQSSLINKKMIFSATFLSISLSSVGIATNISDTYL